MATSERLVERTALEEYVETEIRPAMSALMEAHAELGGTVVSIPGAVAAARAHLRAKQYALVARVCGMIEDAETAERQRAAAALSAAEARAAIVSAELEDQRDRTRTAAGDAYDFGQMAMRHREAFTAFLSDMPPQLLEEMAAAVERGERDLFTDAEGPLVIPLWLAGMADRVRGAHRALTEEERDG